MANEKRPHFFGLPHVLETTSKFIDIKSKHYGLLLGKVLRIKPLRWIFLISFVPVADTLLLYFERFHLLQYQGTTRRCSGEYFKRVNFYGKRQHSFKVKYWSCKFWRKNISMGYNFLWNSILALDFSYSFHLEWMSLTFGAISHRRRHGSKSSID